jgi:methionyl-tRNA formyltransferase
MLQKEVDAAKARLASLQSEKMAQDAINESYDPYLKKTAGGIKLQQKADAFLRNIRHGSSNVLKSWLSYPKIAGNILKKNMTEYILK